MQHVVFAVRDGTVRALDWTLDATVSRSVLSLTAARSRRAFSVGYRALHCTDTPVQQHSQGRRQGCGAPSPGFCHERMHGSSMGPWAMAR